MKNYKLPTNPYQFLSVFGLLLLTLSTVYSVQAQDKTTPKAARIIYISPAPRSSTKIERPRIRFVKRGKSSGDKNSSLKELKKSPYDLEKKTFRLINEQRTLKGLAPLRWSEKASKLARSHSENMARHSFFSHVGLNGRAIDQRANDFGLTGWKSIGENIAYNKGFSNPGEFAVERWMISKGHRINLLNSRWKETGVGIAITKEGKYFFTQIFIVK